MAPALVAYEAEMAALYREFPSWTYADLAATPARHARRQLVLAREMRQRRDDPGVAMERDLGGPDEIHWRGPRPQASGATEGVGSAQPPVLFVPDHWDEAQRYQHMLNVMTEHGMVKRVDRQAEAAG